MAPLSPIKCQLSEWGLPPLIVSWFRKKGIISLFDWQVECLCKDNVLFGDNLVYSAPTSGGKTLVADFLLIKRILEYNKKALVIEPYVALTREKAATLKSMLYTTNARVGAFGGNYYTPGGMASVKVAVCTIEKANNFINRLINENKLSDLGIIVVDEIHHLGDDRRGYQLELLLTKVLYYNSQQDRDKKIQIVGLSATIPNLEAIATWLNASLYVTGFRPVPLVEKIKIESNIYDVKSYLSDPDCQPLEVVDPERICLEKDFDDLCYLCIDSIIEGHSTLVFCESKRECEVMAANLAMQIKFSGNKLKSGNEKQVQISQKLRNHISGEKLSSVLDKLKKCPAGPDKELVKSLSFGVAFHHAGLTSEEREIIEDGFKSGAIKALMATSTLSSGVNLPARRVIIRSPTMGYIHNGKFQKEMLNPTTYKQMIGRAGRKNIDSCGESILICRPDNQKFAIELIKSSLGNINSSLAIQLISSEGQPSGLKKAILEVIANNTAKTKVHLNQYLQSTYWISSSSKKEVDEFMQAVVETLRYLVTKKFIEELKPGVFRSTRLGNAVLASGLHPDESLELLQDLVKARQGFCLLNDLHIIYQVTPNDLARTIELKDWQHYSKVWNDLDDTCQYVGERVGIDEITIARRCQGYSSSIGEEKERIYRRFWVALVINDLIREIPLPKICDKYRMSKAVVQQAQRAVAQFAGVMSIFCEELGYENIAALVTPLESRINFSCQRDLLELIKLNITRPIARALFNAGYRTPITVAKADKLDIEFIIRQIKPFKKDVSFSSDTDQVPSMWVPELATNMTTLDYASHIVETAISFVEVVYELDLPAQSSSKRKEEELSSNDSGTVESEDDGQVQKRGRIENDLGSTGVLRDESIESLESNDINEMVKVKRNIPSFEVKYVGSDVRNLRRFLEKWIVHSSVCFNFKLAKGVNEHIGSKIKKSASRKQSGRRSASELDSLSEGGLRLRHEIDCQKHIVTHIYASFDDEFKVYVIDSKKALTYIRDHLEHFLGNSYASSTAETATQRRRDFVPIKLYTQDIVAAYKVLYSGFKVSRATINKYFEWHSFDVAWWMINYCPNKGPNNCNTSLSLVAKTRWATKYHHFLHPTAQRAEALRKRSHEEFIKLKNIVKAGKTAILKPLIMELLAELESTNQLDAYKLAEIPSRLTMAQTIIHGMGLEMKTMRDQLNLYEDLSNKLSEIAEKSYAKSIISLSNTRDVARVLYDDLDLKKYLLEHRTIADITKDPTNGEVLTILSEYHPFPRLVQDYRKIGKALDALQAVNTHARFIPDLKMMRVFGHCDFWQLTGRVAMSDPDLFLINRNFSVVLPAYRNHVQEVIECQPRNCFIPNEGWIMVAADYSQLELRLLAHFSEDENLLEILNRSLDSEESFDVFKTVASRIFKKPVDQITDENRQHTKQICYGIIYGMGNTTLSNKLGVDIARADEFRKEFFSAFPRLLAYTEDVVKDCKKKGYVESILGRRRFLDGIKSGESSARSRAERIAINSRIQSSASDIIKLAMQMMNQQILNHFENNARLVLEMHDELIYEVSPTILTRFAKILKFTMERMEPLEALKAKLLVNLKKGNSWSSLETFSTETL